MGGRERERQNGSSSFSEEEEEDEPGRLPGMALTASLRSLTTWAGLAGKPRWNFAGSSLVCLLDELHLLLGPGPQVSSYYYLEVVGPLFSYQALSATSHMRLKAPDRCILEEGRGSHGVLSPRVTGGQSVQFQPLIAWKSGLTTSHALPSPKSRVT